MSNKRKRKTTSDSLQISLAEYLLPLDLGSQIFSVRELAIKFDASVGTISHIFQDLEKQGAVEIERRGHLGSFLVSRSISTLWEIIEASPMVIAFTIPSNSRFEGLATGIKAVIQSEGIKIYLIFIRGSSTRMKALREDRCHAVVLSQLSADDECSKNEEVILSFPKGSWLKENRIFTRVGEQTKEHPLRVGVDPDSFDHFLITKLTFGDENVEYIKTNFTQLPRLFQDGHIDATIWNTEDEKFSGEKDVISKPLPNQVQETIDGKDISAAIVTNKFNKIARIVLKEVIDIDEILRIQAEVMAGKYIPEY